MSKPFLEILVTEPVLGIDETITQIPVDARISTSHSFNATVTEFPVEEGALITDHVHLQPDTLSIEGFVSDAPVGIVPASVPLLKGDKGLKANYTRSKDAYEVIIQVYRERILLTIVTRFATYQDMVIERLDIQQSRERSTGLWFTMGLKKIVTVETLTAALPPDIVAKLKRRRAKTTKKLRETGLLDKYWNQALNKVEQGIVATGEAGASLNEAAGSLLARFL